MQTPLRSIFLVTSLACASAIHAAAPVATDDSYAIDQDQSLQVDAPGVLGNDTDADGNPLTAAVTSQPGSGTLTLQSSGAFTYTPQAGFYGTDSFSYEANDGTSSSNTAVVALTVRRYGGTGGPTYSSGGGGYGGAPSRVALLLLALAALYPRGLKLSKRRAISP